MSRFRVYQPKGGDTLVLDLQNDILGNYSTRVVAPLAPLVDFDRPAGQLNPVLEIGGEPFVVQTHFLGAVPEYLLGLPVDDLSDQADQITRALDLLFQGY